MGRLLAASLVLVALVAAAAGCGGGSDGSGDEEAAAAWADTVCSALADWRSGLAAIGESIASDPTSIDRETIEEAASDAQAVTDELVAALREAGAPDTEGGQEAKAVIDQLAEDLEQQLEDARRAVENASGITGILRAIGDVTTAFTSAGNAIATALDDLRDLDVGGELERALRDSEACGELTGA